MVVGSLLERFCFFWVGLVISAFVYSIIIDGLSSNIGYSLLGGLRVWAQTISYKVRLALIFLSFVFFFGLCPRWDLNPPSQQASGHRPTP